jgi:predicted nucleotidyltransferase
MPGLSKENQLLNSDFRDILSAFCEEKVEFMLVGAYAVAAHGLPRATGDIDLWVKSSQLNAERVWAALSKFGAPLGNITKHDFVARGNVIQIGVTPRRIDILTEITGLAYEDAEAQTITIELEGMRIPVIGLTHLIQNKSAVGRPQDKADVARLQEMRKK